MKWVMQGVIISLLGVTLLGGCRTGPYVTKAQTACSSPLLEFNDEFRNTPDKLFRGRYVGNEELNGQRALCFQFPDVLVGEARVLDIRICYDGKDEMKGYANINESTDLKPQIDEAVLKGMTSSRSLAYSTLAAEEKVKYVIRPYVDNMHYVFRDYDHTVSFFFAHDGSHNIYNVDVNLDWVVRSRAKSLLLRVPYLVTIPVDTVLVVVLLPFDLALGILSGGDPPFSILGFDEQW